MQFRRKCSGRSRQGTRPSAASRVLAGAFDHRLQMLGGVEVAIDIGPAPRPAERHGAAARAVGEALHLPQPHPFRHEFAEGLGQDGARPRRVPRRLSRWAGGVRGPASGADQQFDIGHGANAPCGTGGKGERPLSRADAARRSRRRRPGPRPCRRRRRPAPAPGRVGPAAASAWRGRSRRR